MPSKSASQPITLSETAEMLLDNDTFGMDHDTMRVYASQCVASKSRALEYLMMDFAANEVKLTDNHTVRVSGELHVMVGTIGIAATYFLEWAEREGLLVITDKGRRLSSCFVDSENLEVGELPVSEAQWQDYVSSRGEAPAAAE